MKVNIQVERGGAGVAPTTVGEIERTTRLQAGTLGLMLAAAKAVLARLQHDRT